MSKRTTVVKDDTEELTSSMLWKEAKRKKDMRGKIPQRREAGKSASRQKWERHRLPEKSSIQAITIGQRQN